MTASQKVTQEQVGVSALKAIEYLQPIVQDIIEKQNQPGRQQELAGEMSESLKKMSQEEIMLLGHRLDTLHQVTELLLTLVGVVALQGLVYDEPVDPRLS